MLYTRRDICQAERDGAESTLPYFAALRDVALATADDISRRHAATSAAARLGKRALAASRFEHDAECIEDEEPPGMPTSSKGKEAPKVRRLCVCAGGGGA
jgi:hypothetical protein